MKISSNLIQTIRLLKVGKFWGAMLAWMGVMYGLCLLIALMIRFILPNVAASHSILFFTLTLLLILTAPLFAGMNMAAIKCVRHEAIPTATVFQYFPQWLPLAFSLLIFIIINFIINFILNQVIFSVIPFWLPDFLINVLVFNGIFSLLIFVFPLIADKKLSLWAAFRTSVKFAKQNWWKLFILFTLFYTINLINVIFLLTSQIPFLGIICYITINIVLIPFIFLNIGIAYHQLFDRDPTYAQPFLPSN